MTFPKRATSARAIAALLLPLTVGSARRADAADRASERSTDCASAPERRPDGGGAQTCEPSLDMSIAFDSAYVYRGYNLFQAERQDDQKWVAKPSVVWTDAADRWSVGYLAAYQLGGDDLWENVDAGLGSEQIVFVDYELRPAPHLVVSPDVAVYAYPEAHAVPLSLEPSVELWYLGPVKLGVTASYLYSVRSGAIPEDYVYVHPQVAETLSITKRLEFTVVLGAGLKLFRSQAAPGGADNNLVDVLVLERLRYELTPVFYVEAKGAIAWTNLTAKMDPISGAVVTPSFTDECAPYWGFKLGASF